MVSRLRQQIYEHLLACPQGASSAELLARSFLAGHGGRGDAGRRYLVALLGDDRRLVYDGDADRWRVRRDGLGWCPIEEATYVVVDLETTGGGPEEGAITEIGAVRVRAGRIVDTFVTLVNPCRPIQPFVVHLTGITDAMVRDAPGIEDALPAFLAFAGDDVLVAHNTAFDLRQIGRALEALALPPLHQESLCTLRLARRLLPDLPRRNLDAVATELGIACTGRHRALDDARITAQVLCAFLERARARGLERVADVVGLQRVAGDGEPLVVRVPPERIEQAENVPGVYHILGEGGQVIHVGRALRLRDRLRDCFALDRDHGRAARELIRSACDVRTIPTGSVLTAALLEARQVRDLRPPFNRLGRTLPRLWFVKVGTTGLLPRVWVAGRLGLDGARYVGPFASREDAEAARDELARAFGLRLCSARRPSDVETLPCRSDGGGPCHAPCAGRIGADAYGRRLEAFRRWLEGGPLPRAAARSRPALDGIRSHVARVGWVSDRRSFLVLVPGATPGEATCYAVLAGRLAVEARLGAAADLRAAVARVRARWEHFHATPPARAEVESMSILAGWLRDRAREGVVLPLAEVDDLERRLDELAVTLGDLRQQGPLPSIDALS